MILGTAVVVALVGMAGIVAILIAGLPSAKGWDRAVGPSRSAEALLDRLAGAWEGEEVGGKVIFEVRKDHTATLTTPREVIHYTWELDSAEENSVVLRTTDQGGVTTRSRLVFLSADQSAANSPSSARSLRSRPNSTTKPGTSPSAQIFRTRTASCITVRPATR
jgi:hypothetical protein